MADFIQLVENWSFSIDLYFGMFFFLSVGKKKMPPPQVHGTKLNFKDFYKTGSRLKTRPPHSY